MQDVQHIRNVVFLGHGNSGKSTLAEALLFTAGSLKRLGKVDDGIHLLWTFAGRPVTGQIDLVVRHIGVRS